METKEKIEVTVKTLVNAPVEKVWKYWTSADHITKWNNASEDWHTPEARNDLTEGGVFNYRMEARDGSSGFDFGGVYRKIKTYELIEYMIADGRKVRISFKGTNDQTEIIETFETEKVNSIELQREGWQSILDNFKRYTENN